MMALRELVAASVIAALVMVGQSALAQVNALPDRPHILVYGSAQARALPDRFKLAINVSSTDMSAEAARQRVAGLFDTVLRQLDAAGVPDGESEATTLSIQTRQSWDEATDQQVVIGMEVSRSIQARFDSLDRLEVFLSELETSANLTIGSVESQLSSEPELMRQLRAKAIEDSRDKARAIARAYGVELGSLYSVSDVAPQFAYGIREGAWPHAYEWSQGARGRTLDRIEVSGSKRVEAETGQAELFRAGYIDFQSKLYAVFHIGQTGPDQAGQ